MVEISISGDHLHLEVKGLDKLWAFKSQLEIPLRHIRSVQHDAEAASGWWHGIKLIGANLLVFSPQDSSISTASACFGMFTIQTSPSSLSFTMIASMS